MSRTKEALRAAKRLLKKKKGKLKQIDLATCEMDVPHWMTRAYKNNRYVVTICDNALMTNGVIAVRAMVQRHDDRPIPRHWHEMQLIKNELFGDEATAIEYYPAASELIDNANVYWLWVLPAGVLPTPWIKKTVISNEP